MKRPVSYASKNSTRHATNVATQWNVFPALAHAHISFICTVSKSGYKTTETVQCAGLHGASERCSSLKDCIDRNRDLVPLEHYPCMVGYPNCYRQSSWFSMEQALDGWMWFPQEACSSESVGALDGLKNVPVQFFLQNF